MKLFSIFGDPVFHSISPRLHNNAIRNLNLDACYIRQLVKNGDEIIEIFKDLRLDGANVTVPHKETAYKLCDEVRGIAKEIKAINTLINENGKIIGYNTDAPGFFQAISSFKNIKKALILGAGGTAKAISFILRQNNIDVTILNRSKERLEFFMKNGFDSFHWNNFNSNNFDIIINTTSAGLKDENLPLPIDILSQIMQNASYTFDVVYGRRTPFLQLSDKYNLQNKNGQDMLLYQGIIAFNLFYNNKFNTSVIEKHMREALTF
ncbi:MAG: shikimate dehydrogenase [Sulfurospirillaceae bacterium]|nr:shikimate dehydrogenase [Sulfurospirillaceae bacterium]